MTPDERDRLTRVEEQMKTIFKTVERMNDALSSIDGKLDGMIVAQAQRSGESFGALTAREKLFFVVTTLVASAYFAVEVANGLKGWHG